MTDVGVVGVYAWDGATFIPVLVDATGKLQVVGGGGGGGGVAQQGARDATVQNWFIDVQAAIPLALDAATLAALETITVANLLNPHPISGTVALDAATLAALETISVANFPAVQPVNDNGGSLTVDAPQGTPVFVRESVVPMTWVSASNVAPAASAVQADTGALAAGDYDFDIQLMVSDTVAVGKALLVEHRNAANGATLQTLGGCAPSGQIQINLQRVTLAANERIRVIVGTVAGAATSRYVSAIGRRVS